MIAMSSPLRVIPGVIIVVAGLYSTRSAIVAALLIAVFRFLLGGIGMPSALATIFSVALLGIIARRYFSVRLNKYRSRQLYAIGNLLVLISGIWAYLSPFPEAWKTFYTNLLPLLIWYPASTLLLGSLFAQQLSRQEMEDELRASNERYDAIVNDQVDLIVRWKSDGTIIFANDAFCRYFKQSRAQLIGHSLFLLLHERLQGEACKTIHTLTPENPVLTKVVYLDGIGDQNRWFEWVHRSAFNEQQQLIEIQSVGRDVTERRESENHLKHQSDFQALLIRLTTRFINVPAENFDGAMNDALREVGEFLGGLRCIINVLDTDRISFIRTYEWCTPGVNSLRGTLNPIPNSDVIFPHLLNGETYVVSDLVQLAHVSDTFNEFAKIGVRASILVPIIRQGQLREVVSLSWDHPITIQPESINLIRVLGEIYQNAVEHKEREDKLRTLNAELEKRVQERTTQLREANQFLHAEITERKQAQEAEHEQRMLVEALHDTSVVLNSTLKLDEVLDYILINIDRVVKHDVATIMLIESDNARVVRHRDYPLVIDRSTINGVRLPVHSTPSLMWMMKHREPLLIPEINNYPGWVVIPELTWLHSYLGVPICQGDEVIGFLSLECAIPDFFTPEHAQRLQAFADHAALAIKNAKLYEQANTLAAFRERQRLVRELHDSVSQMLFSANTIAESLPLILDRHPDKLRQYMANLHNFTRGAMGEMRTLFLELRPEALAQTELGLLLAHLCNAFTGRTQIEVERHFNDSGLQFSTDIQMTYYRIAQEAFNNIIKHAQPTTASITLDWIEGWLSMVVSDNGKGFEPVGVSSDHLGIQIMRERAASIDAEFAINSEPGKGTEIVVRSKVQGVLTNFANPTTRLTA